MHLKLYGIIEIKNFWRIYEKWEYEVYAHTYTIDDPDANYMIEMLNDFGEKGWESYAVHNEIETRTLIYFF